MKKLPKSLTTPDFSRPTMWAAIKPGYRYLCRLRIIYPNGKAEWFHDYDGQQQYLPCWGFPDGYWVPNSSQEAVKMMKEYDEYMGFTTLFMGNI